MRSVADGDRRQAVIATDTVFGMNHEIAGRQRRQLVEEGICTLLALCPAHEPISEQVLFRQKRQVGRGEAVIEGQDGQSDALCSSDGLRFLPAFGRREPQHAMIG